MDTDKGNHFILIGYIADLVALATLCFKSRLCATRYFYHLYVSSTPQSLLIGIERVLASLAYSTAGDFQLFLEISALAWYYKIEFLYKFLSDEHARLKEGMTFVRSHDR